MIYKVSLLVSTSALHVNRHEIKLEIIMQAMRAFLWFELNDEINRSNQNSSGRGGFQ